MIKRFDWFIDDNDDGYLIESGDGDFIKFKDYKILVSDYDALKDKYNKLMTSIGEILMDD